MGKKKKQEKIPESEPKRARTEPRAPRFGRSSAKIMVGRTIGAKRERLETRNERAAARQKDKRKYAFRVTSVSIIFLVIIAVLIIVAVNYFASKREEEAEAPVAIETTTVKTPEPTIEIIDEGSTSTEGRITSRMREYIASAEADFRDLDLAPIKAVLPAGSIREVDFYLEGYPGRIKMLIDRGSAVSVEDASRVLRYLAENGITEYEYIDVRIEGKAYWK